MRLHDSIIEQILTYEIHSGSIKRMIRLQSPIDITNYVDRNCPYKIV